MGLSFSGRFTLPLQTNNILQTCRLLGLSQLCAPAHEASRPYTRCFSASMSDDSQSPVTNHYATPYVTAFAAVPSVEVANKLSRLIVEKKLAACVNTIPGVTSTYWWKGAVQQDAELLLMMKTRAKLVPQLSGFIKHEHPYDVPELIVQPIIDGNDDYLRWIADSTESSDS